MSSKSQRKEWILLSKELNRKLKTASLKLTSRSTLLELIFRVRIGSYQLLVD